MRRLGIVLAVVGLAPALVWAHGGGLDKYGCHHDKKAGSYHCHRGEFQGKSFKSQEEMLAGKKAGGGKADKADTSEKTEKGSTTKK